MTAGRALQTYLSQMTRKVRLFADIIVWMLADIRRNAMRLSLLIVGLSIASVITRLLTIVMLMYYVHAQTTGNPIIVRGYEIPSDTSFTTLSIWGGCVLLLAITAGLCAYFGESLSFKMAREAMARASDRALDVIAAGQSHSLPLWSNGGMKMISSKAIMSDSMMLMRSVLVLNGIAVPLITLSVFGAVLFWLNLKLTLFLIPAILIYAVPFYLLNRGIATASRDYELRQVVRARAVTRILDFALQTQYPEILRPVWADHFKADPSTQKVIDSYRLITLTRRKLAMLQDILYGVVLCVLLIVFGSFIATSSTTEWFPLVAYLFFLRHVMMGMNGTASLIIALNRFAPQTKRLKDFITADIPTASTHAENTTTKPLCILAVEPKLEGSMNSASPQVGDVIACIVTTYVDSYHVKDFCEKLLSKSKQASRLFQDSVYCGYVQNIPQLRICELITGKSDPDSDSIKQAELSLKQMGVLSELQDLPMRLNAILTEAVVDSLSPTCRFALCLSYAVSCSRKYVVLDWRPLSLIQEAGRKKILDAFSDRVVVIVSINGHESLISNATLVVVIDDTAVRGIGDPAWFEQIAHDHFPGNGNSVLAGVVDDSNEDEMLDDL